MHPGVMKWGSSVITPSLVEGKEVLEVGSRDVNGSFRDLIEPLKPGRYVGIDIEKGPGVDIVMDVSKLLHFAGERAWDLIVCNEMLEHCEDWQDAVWQMKAALRVRGTLIITTRSPGYPQHDFPGDYWRYTDLVMAKALEDLGSDVQIEQDPGYEHPDGGWMPQPGIFVIATKQNIKPARPTVKAMPAPGYIPPLTDIDLFDPILADITDGDALKLDIGAGGHTFKRTDMTWKSVDKYAEADYTADMWDLPFEEGRVDAIWGSHVLEHAEMAQVIPTLEEWFRVLKPSGTCTVIVPDFDYVAQYWLANGPMTGNGMVFGNQIHPGEFHKVGFTKDSLVEDLEGVGFVVDKAEVVYTEAYTQYSIWAEAHKP